MPKTKKPTTTPDITTIQREHAYMMTRPVMPRRMTLLNTTRAQGKPAKGTVNHELGMYSLHKPAELRELDRHAHSHDGFWMRAPRLIKRSKDS